MSFGYCYNEREHRDEGRRDFERHHYPDREKYRDHFNDCNEAYTEGYDEARRESERREERNREEQEREDCERRLRHQREQEDSAYADEQREIEEGEERNQYLSETVPNNPDGWKDSTDELPF